MLRFAAARHVAVWILVALCGATASARSLAAQSTSRVDSTRASLRLRVASMSNAPIADAEVTLRGNGDPRVARSDSAGDARFDGLAAGLHHAVIRRVGFGAANVDLRLGAGDNVLIVRLDKSSATLDEVRIVANRLTTARLDDFETRRLRGDANTVITRDEIEKRAPIALSQLLRRAPGLRIADSAGNIVAVSARGMKMSRAGTGKGLVQCVMRVTVDGVVLPPLSNIDQVIPNTVYGIEIFEGPARLPLQFAGLRADNWCGLIAIWTREQ